MNIERKLKYVEPLYTIEDLSQVRALSHPLRIEVIKRLCEEPLSVGDVARRLSLPANKLHYHVGELERAGLVVVVEKRRKGHLVEKVYRAVGRSITVDRSIFAEEEGGIGAWYDVIASVLDSAAIDLRRAIEDREIEPESAERTISLQEEISVSPERYEAFRERLSALISEFKDLDEGDGSRHRAALTVLLYPARNSTGRGTES